MNGPAHIARSVLASKAAWIGLALLGMVVAAAISIAASRLSSQQIGISSEPLSAGRELAPPAVQTPPAGAPAHGGSGEPHGTPTSPGGSSGAPATPLQSPTSPGVSSPPPGAPPSADEDKGSETPGFDADD